MKPPIQSKEEASHRKGQVLIQRGFVLRTDGSLEVHKRTTMGTENVDQVLTLNPRMSMELQAFLNKHLR